MEREIPYISLAQMNILNINAYKNATNRDLMKKDVVVNVPNLFLYYKNKYSRDEIVEFRDSIFSLLDNVAEEIRCVHNSLVFNDTVNHRNYNILSGQSQLFNIEYRQYVKKKTPSDYLAESVILPDRFTFMYELVYHNKGNHTHNVKIEEFESDLYIDEYRTYLFEPFDNYISMYLWLRYKMDQVFYFLLSEDELTISDENVDTLKWFLKFPYFYFEMHNSSSRFNCYLNDSYVVNSYLNNGFLSAEIKKKDMGIESIINLKKEETLYFYKALFCLDKVGQTNYAYCCNTNTIDNSYFLSFLAFNELLSNSFYSYTFRGSTKPKSPVHWDYIFSDVFYTDQENACFEQNMLNLTFINTFVIGTLKCLFFDTSSYVFKNYNMHASYKLNKTKSPYVILLKERNKEQGSINSYKEGFFLEDKENVIRYDFMLKKYVTEPVKNFEDIQPYFFYK